MKPALIFPGARTALILVFCSGLLEAQTISGTRAWRDSAIRLVSFQKRLRKLPASRGQDLALTEEGRPLTPGEIQMLYRVFGPLLDYPGIRVRVVKDVEREKEGVTAIVSPYSPRVISFIDKNSYHADFSKSGSLDDDVVFVHEMVHVYQFARKGFIRSDIEARIENIKGLPQNYGHIPDQADKGFDDYGMEQQAWMVGDYFRCLGLTRGKPGCARLFSPALDEFIQRAARSDEAKGWFTRGYRRRVPAGLRMDQGRPTPQ